MRYMISSEEAKDIISQAVKLLNVVQKPLEHAAGLVLGADIHARRIFLLTPSLQWMVMLFHPGNGKQTNN